MYDAQVQEVLQRMGLGDSAMLFCEDCLTCDTCQGVGWTIAYCLRVNVYRFTGGSFPPMCLSSGYRRIPILGNAGPLQWNRAIDSSLCSDGTKQRWIFDYRHLDAYAPGKQFTCPDTHTHTHPA